MPRRIKLALITTSLCGGVLLTSLAMRHGWRLAVSWTCGSYGESYKRLPSLEPRQGRAAVDAFLAAHGRCPTAERELVAEAFFWSLRDDWNQRLFYTCFETADDLVVEVRSAGPDRVFWTADDIVAE